jgi:hypothetical protein
VRKISRTQLLVVLAGALAVTMCFGVLTTASGAAGRRRAYVGSSPALGPPTLVGLLQTDGPQYQEAVTDGVGAVTLTIGWNDAEPNPNQFSAAYLGGIDSEINSARDSGLDVILDVGIQYPPSWILALNSASRFVDQYGDVFSGTPSSGNDVANTITDPAVRLALASYLEWLGSQLPLNNVYAIRVGGGPDGELRYPSAEFNGHTDCFWAYDVDTQTGSPVPGWTPGSGTIADASAFLAYYDQNLTDYESWLTAQIGSDFGGLTQLLMLPGWGERPGEVAQGTNSLLTAHLDELNLGLDWTSQLSAIANPSRTIVYTTWLDAPSNGPTPTTEDPADYLAYLVDGKFKLGGENAGGGTLANLTVSVARAKKLHFALVDWMTASQIYDHSEFVSAYPTSVTISETRFHDAIAILR